MKNIFFLSFASPEVGFGDFPTLLGNGPTSGRGFFGGGHWPPPKNLNSTF
jgi:hypothetical protein